MIKIDELTALCDGDDSVLNMLLNLYIEEYGQSDSIIKQRYNTEDIDGLFQITHELKGMFSNLCAQDAVSLAQIVESSSQTGCIPDETAINNLCDEIRNINQQIQALLQ
ncbi:Hpt domain-containing protein [Shewanella sp. Isolate13]|uniref:Hpt domain-containing protein n=1 Tax=Shewanella sp. Isolate13 TaxID=2908531 RepID=UPI001EFE4C6C|nr:Hpt domain-containing protein [Shewanella sp. Isolate13]MCG9730406.1 Hpt domain-containing protein [Shewanella sp. Isolate13]